MKLSDLPPFSVGNSVQLVGGIYSLPDRTPGVGIPRQTHLLAYFPGENTEPVLTFSELVMDPTEWADFLLRGDVQDVQDPISKAILRKSQRQIDQNVAWAVYKRDDYHCRYCRRGDVPLTVDHLVTWESGGPSIMANLVAACRRCNRLRGDRPYEEWITSDDYKGVSGKLAAFQKLANLDLADILSAIPVVEKRRSR